MTSQTLSRPARGGRDRIGYAPSAAGPPTAPRRSSCHQKFPVAGHSDRALRRPHAAVPVRSRRELGETFAFRPLASRGEPIIVVTHPDHVKSLFSSPDLVLSITSESPLRPVLARDRS
jgi:hypothetical protein